VTADTMLSHELDSLHDKLVALHHRRRSASAERPVGRKADRPTKTAEEQGFHGEILEFVRLIAAYVQEAKDNVSNHPGGGVLGAMVVGILIGRLLGRH
jgi:ElaB/YqjD/DUF883 family membrane-anchored ribosome-binding protein